ncbi:MAG: hypothetical protein HFF52_06270 [Lawsonibacter sp.]|nr:hypothetical protein [Lawsonibacter sp.]
MENGKYNSLSMIQLPVYWAVIRIGELPFSYFENQLSATRKIKEIQFLASCQTGEDSL